MSQTKDVKIFGISFVLPANNRISEEATDEETRTTSKKIKIEIEENKDNQIVLRDEDSDDSFAFEVLARSNSSGPPRTLNLIQSLMMPWMLRRKIDDMGGHDIRMVIEKKLCKSDVKASNNRFSIPENKISEEARDFLKPQEIEKLKGYSTDNNKLQGIEVLVLDQNLDEFSLTLKRWRMTSSTTYNLTQNWNYVVECNGFKVDDMVQLWSFRRPNRSIKEEERRPDEDDILGFAVVKIND